jgi:hypothetical protein
VKDLNRVLPLSVIFMEARPEQRSRSCEDADTSHHYLQHGASARASKAR